MLSAETIETRRRDMQYFLSHRETHNKTQHVRELVIPHPRIHQEKKENKTAFQLLHKKLKRPFPKTTISETTDSTYCST